MQKSTSPYPISTSDIHILEIHVSKEGRKDRYVRKDSGGGCGGRWLAVLVAVEVGVVVCVCVCVCVCVAGGAQ
jgi:hypothetical protein